MHSTLPHINIIAAISEHDRGLGFNNDLLWRISPDLKRFKALTTGHPLIMGRKTFDSIGKPLPNRTTIIVTRNTHYTQTGCVVTHSIQEALQKASEIDPADVFVIGGAEIYKEALPHADKLYLTLIHDTKEADVFFPDYSMFTKVVFTEEHRELTPPFTFIELEK